jgi:hypothetical protein
LPLDRLVINDGAGDDYKLALPASSAATLWHKGKVEADKCKVQPG